LSITIDTIACDGTDKEITKLEHVTLTVSFQHRRRGDVSIDLFSPSGTRNEMLSTRRYDDSKNGLHDWTFMTVHNWGENPKGVWVMNVTDNIATLNKGVDVNGYLQHDTSKQEADVEDLEEEVNSALRFQGIFMRGSPCNVGINNRQQCSCGSSKLPSAVRSHTGYHWSSLISAVNRFHGRRR